MRCTSVFCNKHQSSARVPCWRNSPFLPVTSPPHKSQRADTEILLHFNLIAGFSVFILPPYSRLCTCRTTPHKGVELHSVSLPGLQLIQVLPEPQSTSLSCFYVCSPWIFHSSLKCVCFSPLTLPEKMRQSGVSHLNVASGHTEKKWGVRALAKVGLWQALARLQSPHHLHINVPAVTGALSIAQCLAALMPCSHLFCDQLSHHHHIIAMQRNTNWKSLVCVWFLQSKILAICCTFVGNSLQME